MDIFGEILGGAVKDLNPETVVKEVIGGATKPVAKAALTSVFNEHMNANARVALGKLLEKAGQDLQAGEVADASDNLAQVVADIKF